MDGFQQFGVPVVGIVAVAALTFYAVSFMEMSEKSFRDLDEKEDSENGGFNPALRSFHYFLWPDADEQCGAKSPGANTGSWWEAPSLLNLDSRGKFSGSLSSPFPDPEALSFFILSLMGPRNRGPPKNIDSPLYISFSDCWTGGFGAGWEGSRGSGIGHLLLLAAALGFDSKDGLPRASAAETGTDTSESAKRRLSIGRRTDEDARALAAAFIASLESSFASLHALILTGRLDALLPLSSNPAASGSTVDGTIPGSN
nr:putative transmembrane protein [Ipomoea batatas]